MPSFVRMLVVAAAVSALAGPAQAAAAPGKTPPGQARKELREQLGRFGLVSLDRHTGTPRAVGRLDGFLTGESGGAAKDVALRYLEAHGDALGLPGGVPPGLSLAHQDSIGGLQHLAWRQSYRGIPSSDTGLRAAVTASGRLLSLGGAPAPDPSVATIDPKLPARKAYAAVAGHAERITSRGGGPEQATTFARGGSASLVLYQGADGTRLGWRVLAPVSDGDFADATVDAADGTVVRRANRIKHVTGKAFARVPADGFDDVTFDPWLTSATTLKGPYVHAFTDPTNAVHFDAYAVRPADEILAPWDSTTLQSTKQATTQLFYFVNKFQEHLAADPILFTTQNFKNEDAVLAQTKDPSEVKNASFLTLPDGQPGLMQLGVFGTCPGATCKDAANDASIVYHEYTHGMTGRLVTDAEGFGATDTAQASALDEGTSDFFALDYLVPQGGAPRMGEYADPTIREQPINGDFTYAQFGHVIGEPEPHADGEIWAQTLWDIRTLLGSEAARRIVTAALRIAPPQPSYLDMRNAILQAHAGDDADLWTVFTDRGMGYFASTDGSDDVDPVADFLPLPPAGTAKETLSGTVHDEDGNALAGAHVGIAGHDTEGLGPDLADDTDAHGVYSIAGFAGTHPLAIVTKPTYNEVHLTNVKFPSTRNATLPRDFASSAGGASVASFTGPDHTADGCGPGGLIDDSGDTVWGSVSSGVQSIVIDLGAQVDVQSVLIDPSAGCGDDQTAALGGYQVLTAASPGAFASLAGSAFTTAHLGALNDIHAPARQGVRYVQLRALSPQSRASGSSGEDFLDVAELSVTRTPGSPIGPAADTGALTSLSARAATLTGSVRPNGAPPAVTFEYGPTTSYGQAIAASGGSGAVSAAVTGLTPQTEYHYRVVATRDGRRSEGADKTFFTPSEGVVVPPPPGGVTQLVSIKSKTLTASRKGVFRLKLGFTIDAPLRMASVTVTRKGKTIARGRIQSVAAQIRTLTLKLNARGRKLIRPGNTKKVRVTVRLPGSKTATRKLKLKRRR